MKTTKKQYFGSWSANNGSTYSSGYESDNKKQLAKDMREMAKGNTCQGNTGYWQVSELDEDGDQYNQIMSGKVKG